MEKNNFSIELSDDAEIDLKSSFEYYFYEDSQVADSFFKQINISFEEIKQDPEMFPIVYGSIRKYVLKKFPFVIYYRIDNVIVQIIAIFHTSRNPQIWNERI